MTFPDVVYVGTVNTTHYEIVKMLLEAKKPVLCEKPMCMSISETEELITLAKTNSTFLMEVSGRTINMTSYALW